MQLPATVPNMVSPRTLLPLALLLGAMSASAANLYCCPDPATGRRICSDVIPEQCKGRAYKIIDSAGNVVKEVGPPLTPEQKAAQEEEAKRKKLLEAADREQRRRDMALLETYGTVAEIDRQAQRSETELLSAMKQAQERIEEAQKRRKKFEDEAEFYKKKELPVEVARGLKEADDEINAQKSLLVSKHKDLENVRAKFTEDRRRFLEIQAGMRNSMHPGAARPNGAVDSRPR